MMTRVPRETHLFSDEISSLRFQNDLSSGLGQLPGQRRYIHTLSQVGYIFFVPSAISATVMFNSSVVAAHA